MADTVSSKSTNDDHNTTISGSEHISQDVNTDEALSVSNATFNAMSQMNMKRTYDLHQTLDTDALINARRLQNSEAEMRLRHAEEEHKAKLKQDADLHTIRVQTLQVGSVGSSKIVEDIATETANNIYSKVKSKLGK